MYRAFELKINEELMRKFASASCVALDNGIMKNEKAAIDNLHELLSSNIIIDGNVLQEECFPALRKDVFISYSHNDRKLANTIASILSKDLDLTVFLDLMIWESADELLRRIDDQYCLQKDGKTYDYQKRNFSTAHVHAILTSAIMKVMDQAEIVIFLNKPDLSFHLGETISRQGYADRTLSPWIYEEILLTTVLRERDWTVYRKAAVHESMSARFAKLQISYNLPKDKLIPLTIDDIETWRREYARLKEKYPKYYDDPSCNQRDDERHPLNILYKLKCSKRES